MKRTIANYSSKLIKNFIITSIRNFVLSISVLIFFLSTSLHAFETKAFMQNPQGLKVSLYFAVTREEHNAGLSGIKSEKFKPTEAMLFINSGTAPRKFWMPNTFFNLDIIFLDSSLSVIGIEKNAPAHPGIKEPPTIFKTAIYNAQFILETKGSAPFSKNLKVGDKLKFIANTTLSEIISKTHPQQ